ncbi:MAG: hypothetical protein EXS63_04345 [Candidatus Omnitrophica bacterium]|nr:hypothetical protein [Candidatus Omnitrophota bacterium]
MKTKLPEIKLPKFKVPDLKLGIPGVSWDEIKDRLFSFTAKTKVMVIEFGDGWLKIAGWNAAPSGLRTLVGMNAIPTQGLSDLDLGFKIGQFLKENAWKPTHVYILHPSYNLTSRILSLPSLDLYEIKDMIELQAVKQTPYGKEEITSGFRVIDSDATGYSRVLLAISHRDVSSGYFRTAEIAGLSANQINITLEGIRGWYEAVRTQKPKEFQKPVVLIDVDWATAEFMLFSQDKLIFNRTISMGIKHFEEQGIQAEQEFLREVQRSLDGGQAEIKEEPVTKVLITGMHPKIKDLGALISREMNLPSEVIFSLQPFQVGIPSKTRESVSTMACSFAALVGFGFNPKPAEINLIPAQIETKKGLEDRAKDLAILGTMLLALMTLASAVSFEKIYKKHQYLKTLKKDYGAIKNESEEIQRQVAKMKLAAEQLNLGANFLDVMYDITEVLPSDIYFTSFQYNSAENSLVVKGISGEMSAVFKLLTTLEGTPHLELVKTRNVTKRKVKEKEMVEFEVSGNVVHAEADSSKPKTKDNAKPEMPKPA